MLAQRASVSIASHASVEYGCAPVVTIANVRLHAQSDKLFRLQALLHHPQAQVTTSGPQT